MALTINNNTSALIATRQAGKANGAMTHSLERIATGKRINRASDDAASMTIADSLRSRALAAGQEIRNSGDNISIAQTADGALGQMSKIIQDIRIKTIEAANTTNSPDSRTAIQSEINGALDALKGILDTTSYNGQTLLDGTFDTVGLSIGSVAPSKLGSNDSGFLTDIDVTTLEGAQKAVDSLDQALDQVNQVRSDLGASQNQSASNISTLSTTRVNLMAAQSQLRDTDLAEESIILNQMKLLEKAGTYALAQANSSKDNLIDLMG